MKTLGNMIAELEATLAEQRAIDNRIQIWEELFKVASDEEKKRMLYTALRELAGMSEEEVKAILK